jgi:hypothetical protein
MNFPTVRRRRESSTRLSQPLGAGPRVFLTLADEGELAPDQRSLPRRAFMIFAVTLYLMAVPLVWASSSQGATQEKPQAVLAKQGEDDDDEAEEDDGPDTTGDNDTGTGRETAAANTDQHQPGVDTGVSTRGETDADNTGATEQTQGTGAETKAANTDRAGLDTGVSTRGETDPGDHTGQTERR